VCLLRQLSIRDIRKSCILRFDPLSIAKLHHLGVYECEAPLTELVGLTPDDGIRKEYQGEVETCDEFKTLLRIVTDTRCKCMSTLLCSSVPLHPSIPAYLLV
jgi:hypothetical protein